jgi:circadian clock protein KaiC
MLKEKMMGEETHTLRGKQLPIDKLVEQLQEKIKEIGAKRVVLDTLASLFYRFIDPIERRTAGVDLIEGLSDLKTTTLVTTELSELGSYQRKLMDEEFLVHGVIMMQTLFQGGSTVRALQVEKMRGVSVNSNIVPYTIDTNGIEVYPAMSLFRDK